MGRPVEGEAVARVEPVRARVVVGDPEVDGLVGLDRGVEQALARADGIYRLSGRYFVADSGAGGANQARSFDISVPLADDKPATIARAQSQAVGQLARQIAQLAGPGRSIRTSSAPVPDINDIFSQPLPPLEGS